MMNNIFNKTIKGLASTRSKISHIFSSLKGKTKLNNDEIESFEETLIMADIDYDLSDKIISKIINFDNNIPIITKFKNIINDEFSFCNNTQPLKRVILLVGVNGNGKTTTSIKLASLLKKKNKDVMLIGADTYRAAAIEQLQQWSNKLSIDLFVNLKSQSPSSVAYDGMSKGLANSKDHIIIDTAGRLHTSLNLMNELQKIFSVINKKSEDLDIFIVIDSNTGQNAIIQVEAFLKYLPINGVILTKMDGTAKGGIALSIMNKLKIPIYYIGLGEQETDIVPFELEYYLNGLLGSINE